MKKAPAPDPKIEVLFSADQIASRLDELAASLAKRLPSEIVVVPLLKGSFMFDYAQRYRELPYIGAMPG